MSFTYEVRIKGRLSRALLAEFARLGLVADSRQVETQLHGSVVDQAALYGLVRRIEALGLDLIELRRYPPDPPPSDAADPADASDEGAGPDRRRDAS